MLVEDIFLGEWLGRIFQPNRFIGATYLQIMGRCCVCFAFGTKLCNLIDLLFLQIDSGILTGAIPAETDVVLPGFVVEK